MSRSLKSSDFPKVQDHLSQPISDIVDLIGKRLELEVKNGSSPAVMALAAVIEICELYGGGALYFPRTSGLKRKIRDENIFSDYRNNVAVKDIVRKYRICSQSVYEIIEKQRSKTRLS